MNYFEDLQRNVRNYLTSNQKKDLTPPYFFHEQAISLCERDFLGERHIESIYATLVAW